MSAVICGELLGITHIAKRIRTVSGKHNVNCILFIFDNKTFGCIFIYVVVGYGNGIILYCGTRKTENKFFKSTFFVRTLTSNMCCCGSGSCFAGMCCGTCTQCTAVKSGPISRLPYLFLFIASGIFSIVMSIYGEESLNLVFFDAQLCSMETCMGNGSVYRTSFILFLFELIHVIIIGAGLVAFHWLFFVWKFLAFIVSLTLTFVISNDDSNAFFQGYADYFARFISAIYLILQILILIIWAYEINEKLVKETDEYGSNNNDDEDDRDEDERGSQCLTNPWAWTFALLTLSCYIATFTILGMRVQISSNPNRFLLCQTQTGYFYVWYGGEKGCGLNITLITVTIVLCH